MIAGISAICSIVLGTGVAYVADRYPTYRAALETVGGFLIIVGFGITGFAFQVALRHP
jgi:putative flippase GtrA